MPTASGEQLECFARWLPDKNNAGSVRAYPRMRLFRLGRLDQEKPGVSPGGKESKYFRWLKVNGKTMQDSNTSDFIFGVLFLISNISEFMTLLPGDVISTGTSQRVGLGLKPPRYLKSGDIVESGIEGLGQARQRIVTYVDKLRSGVASCILPLQRRGPGRSPALLIFPTLQCPGKRA